MLAQTPIVEQLRASGFARVEGVLELPPIDQQPRALPALWTVPRAERASPNTLAGARDQAVEDSFSVIVTVDGTKRNRAGVSEELKEQVDRVIAAIAGWRHPEASRACDYSGGQLIGAAGGPAISWAVHFTTRHHLRKDR